MNWKTYTLAGLVLAVLALTGSREHFHSIEIKKLTSERDELVKQEQIARAQSESLQKQLKIKRTSKPVLIGNQVAYETTEEIDQAETQLKQASEQISTLTSEKKELQIQLASKELIISKPAPKWNVMASWEPTTGTFYAGAGINVGPLSITVDNPFALEFKPRLSLMARL